MPNEGDYVRRFLVGDVPAPVGIAPVDSHGVDAFGRVRVSEPADIIDAQFEYDLQPLYWDSFVTGSARVAHIPEQSAVGMFVSGTASVALRESHGYLRYQPGKSQLVNLTYQHTPSPDTLFRIGYYDDGDGIFLEHSGTAVNIVLRSSAGGGVQETRVPQAAWNTDRFDGSSNDRYNPTNILLDHSQAQHFVVDMQWLGVGRARAGFFIDGLIHDAHKFNSANMLPRPYMRTANLPIRSELRGLPGIASERSAMQICAAVHSEGGVSDERGKPFVATLGMTGTSVTSRLPVLAIRPRATFRGQINREMIVPQQIILETDDASIYWELLHGPSISGSNWTLVDADSGVEMNRGATLIYSGTRVADGYLTLLGVGVAAAEKVAPVASKLRIALGIQGEHPVFPSDNLVLVATSLGVGATNVRASIHGKEVR